MIPLGKLYYYPHFILRQLRSKSFSEVAWPVAEGPGVEPDTLTPVGLLTMTLCCEHLTHAHAHTHTHTRTGLFPLSLKMCAGSSCCDITDQPCLWRGGMQVRSPAQHSGLRIWRCHSCGIVCNCGLDLIPVLGTPYATGWPKRKKETCAGQNFIGISLFFFFFCLLLSF